MTPTVLKLRSTLIRGKREELETERDRFRLIRQFTQCADAINYNTGTEIISRPINGDHLSTTACNFCPVSTDNACLVVKSVCSDLVWSIILNLNAHASVFGRKTITPPSISNWFWEDRAFYRYLFRAGRY